jgi:glycosyltransferase involved in cell wall biosynthesis
MRGWNEAELRLISMVAIQARVVSIRNVPMQKFGKLTVGLWPGASFAGNGFASIFSRSLEALGARVVDLDDPGAAPADLDILHIHWPEKVFWQSRGCLGATIAVLRLLGALRKCRRRGAKIVWMVHNLRPHDLRRCRALLWTALERGLGMQCDGFMTLAPSTIALVRANIRGLRHLPAASALHPLYDVPFMPIGQVAARDKCRLHYAASTRLFSLLGMLRPYKGLEQLIEVFSATANQDIGLLIAGQPINTSYGNKLAEMCKKDSRISLRLGRISDREFFDLLQASHAVILPYQSYLHSGAMIHAVSAGKPVITPETPFSSDLALAIGEPWVVRYSGKLTSDMFSHWREPDSRANLENIAPERLAEAALGLYRDIRGQGH